MKYVDQLFYKELGKAIAEQRREKGLSLKEVAKQMGTTKQNLDLLELGLRKVKAKEYEKLCEVLEIYDKIGCQVKVGL